MTKIILKGKKVILRPLSLKDAPRFCEWLKDPEATKFLSTHGQPPPSLKEERQWIAEQRRSKKNLVLAIDTVDGEHIGSISLRNIISRSRRANFGIAIGNQRYWGQGLGTEACKLIVDYGFRKFKLHRISLELIAYNIRGLKSYKKVGFKVEGRLRDYYWRGGYWHDQIKMGLLQSEYFQKGIRK